MNQKEIQKANEKWLARDYTKFKESQSKLNKHMRLDFRSEAAQKKDNARLMLKKENQT